MVRDDQIDAELARPPRRVGPASAAVHGNRQRDALGVQAVDGGRLQAVAVAQPFRDEVHDVGAQELQRAPKDDRRRDAVDVVVAVNGDPLLARHGGHDAIDGGPHVGEGHRVVQLIERRLQETRSQFRVAQAALTEQPRNGLR